MAVRGFRGVRDDLSEIGRHLVDIACFLSPLLPAAHHDSPPPSPRPASSPSPPPPKPRPSARGISGILSDLSEIGGGFRNGLSRFSAAFRGHADEDEVSGDRSSDAREIGLSEEVIEFVRHLVKSPESWLEFPVPIDDGFHLSRAQKEHISTVEHLYPDLLSLRLSLCPTYMSEESFWMIYFALLHPTLNKHDSELLSTYKIVESMRIMAKEKHSLAMTSRSQNLDSHSLPSSRNEKCSSVRQNHKETWQDASIIKTSSQQSIDQWSDVTSAVDASSDAPKLTPDHIALKDGGEGNVLVMEKYMDSLFTEERMHPPYSFRRKHVSSSEENMAYKKVTKLKVSSDEESGDWQAVEDSDFEILEKSSGEKSTESLQRHA